ncbi:MAG: hypothetical protein CVV48_08285 [Spirochaetae bacterium HGW-Spirochaetae-4]|nr:MAG: hypothetical protein CVV48_08285 [Spirochaetae bacterium HGW-Spirochaetae-4]
MTGPKQLEGMRELAKSVISVSLKDLDPKKPYAKRQEAVLFFESGRHFSLMCNLGDLDESDVLKKYHDIVDDHPLKEPEAKVKPKPEVVVPEWYRKGLIGIFQGKQMLKATSTVKEAAEFTGLSSQSVYSSLKTGKEVGGYRFDRNILPRRDIHIEKSIQVYLKGRKVGKLKSPTEAAAMCGLSWQTVLTYISSGRTTKRGYRFKRVGEKV